MGTPCSPPTKSCLTRAEADTLYEPLSEDDGLDTEEVQDIVGAMVTGNTEDGLSVTYDDPNGKLNFTNSDKGSTAIAAHVAVGDPHPQYLTQAEADALYGQSPFVTVNEYGALGDNSNDDTSAFNAALAAVSALGGGTVAIIPTGSAYKITSTVAIPSNITLIGFGTAEVRIVSGATATIFRMSSATNAVIDGVVIDGNAASVPTGQPTVELTGCTDSGLKNCIINDGADNQNGCVIVTGASTGCFVTDNKINDSLGSGIGLTGSLVQHCEIMRNEIERSDAFGIFLGGGPSRNKISYNSCKDSGLELIGITSECSYNVVNGNLAESSGDNGISITGSHNTVVGNLCLNSRLSGIGVYGSFNTVTGNTCLNSNQVATTNPGILVQAAFGGTAQFNNVTGNVLDDDQSSPTQFQGLRVLTNSYTAWANGVSKSIGDYVFNGLNVYRATTAGTTGASAPVHTSGSVSDGGVTWEYKESFISVARPAFNKIGTNVYGRATNGDYFLSFPDDQQYLLDDQAVMGDGTASYSLALRGPDAGTVTLSARNTTTEKGRIRYDHSTNTWNVRANNADVLDITPNGLEMNRAFSLASRTIAAGSGTTTVTGTSQDGIINIQDVGGAGSVEVDLPASGRVPGMSFIVADVTGTASTKNITVDGNGANIDGAGTLVISTNYGVADLYWSGTIWKTR